MFEEIKRFGANRRNKTIQRKLFELITTSKCHFKYYKLVEKRQYISYKPINNINKQVLILMQAFKL